MVNGKRQARNLEEESSFSSLYITEVYRLPFTIRFPPGEVLAAPLPYTMLARASVIPGGATL